MTKKLTKKQKENIAAKHRPLEERTYMLTDSCFWEQNPPADYNPLDPNRKPHAISLVDLDTGSMVMLKSGSLIKVVEANE